MTEFTLDEKIRRDIADALANALIIIGGKRVSVAHMGLAADKLEELVSSELYTRTFSGKSVVVDFDMLSNSRSGHVSSGSLKDHPLYHRILRSLLAMANRGALPEIAVSGRKLKISFEVDPIGPEYIKFQLANYNLDASRLGIIVDVNEVPADVVIRLLAALDRVHHAWGGGGLELESIEVTTVADAAVSV